jgi:hypothetical protein
VSLALAFELVDAALDGVGRVALVFLVAVGVGGLPVAFVGGRLLGLAAFELLDERLDAQVVLLLLRWLFLLGALTGAAVLALALDLREQLMHGPLALDLRPGAPRGGGEGQVAARGRDPRA